MQIVPQDERHRRRPVWEALSALFLDTELDDAQLRSIAESLKSSGYSEAELHDILATEIAPLLYPNLSIWVTIAGVWDGFDINWIEREIVAGKHRAIRKWYNLGNRWICNRILRDVKHLYWHRVMAGVHSKKLPAG